MSKGVGEEDRHIDASACTLGKGSRGRLLLHFREDTRRIWVGVAVGSVLVSLPFPEI